MPWIIGGAMVGGAVLGKQGGAAANTSNARQAKKANAFTQAMDDSSYQRAVRDLELAGLNPMLAYSQGGAPSHAGTAGAPMQNENAGISDTIHSGVSAYRQSMEAKNLAAMQDKIVADTDASRAAADKARADAAVSAVMVPKIQADTIGSANSASYTAASEKLVNQNVQKALAETENIGEERLRIKAAVTNLLADTETKSFTQDQIRHAIDVMVMQIKGMSLDQIKKALEMQGVKNEADKASTFFGKNVSPYTKDMQQIIDSIRGAQTIMRR